jgi:hypothetical protein
VTRLIKVKQAPIGALDLAARSASGWRQIKPAAEAAAMMT